MEFQKHYYLLYNGSLKDEYTNDIRNSRDNRIRGCSLRGFPIEVHDGRVQGWRRAVQEGHTDGPRVGQLIRQG